MQPVLFALAWFPIDECGRKLDIPASNVAPNDWLWKEKSTRAQRAPRIGLSSNDLVKVAWKWRRRRFSNPMFWRAPRVTPSARTA